MTVEELLSDLAGYTAESDEPLQYEVVLDTPNDARYNRTIDTRIDHQQRRLFLHGA